MSLTTYPFIPHIDLHTNPFATQNLIATCKEQTEPTQESTDPTSETSTDAQKESIADNANAKRDRAHKLLEALQVGKGL